MTTVNEQACAFEHQGRVFTANGAYVDDERAHVYVEKAVKDNGPTIYPGTPINVTTWKGEPLGTGRITRIWCQHNGYGAFTRMVQIRFALSDGRLYSGRLNWDGGSLIRAKRVNR